MTVPVTRSGNDCWMRDGESGRWYNFRKRDTRLLFTLYPDHRVPELVRRTTPDNLNVDYMWCMAMARGAQRDNGWAHQLYKYINGHEVDKSNWKPSRHKQTSLELNVKNHSESIIRINL